MAGQASRSSNASVRKRSRSTGPTFIDLFAGCGGLALGFGVEGFEAVEAVEWDVQAAETYRLNVDKKIEVVDVSRVVDWPEADVVVGGPPCQGFSQLGTRDPGDPRSKLWREYVRALVQSRARVFVMENVPHLLGSNQFRLFRRAVEDRGFSVVSSVLNAADYGVPQTRLRAIIIGSRLGTPWLPEPTHGTRDKGLPPHVTVHQAFTQPTPLPEMPDGFNWHVGRPNIQPQSMIRYRAVPPDGGNRFQMQAALDKAGKGHLVPDCWRNRPSGTTDTFGRLWWGKPAVTIRTEFFKPEKGRYLHPTADRPITVREAARLQSFPDWFSWPTSQSTASVARQIGNAVPPLLASAIARAVLAHIVELEGAATGHRRHTAQMELVG